MPNSYEHSYQHDLDNVIDASDAVLAIGTEKVDTTTLKDRSLNGNDATIHGAMPSSGYFLGRRFDADNENYLNCGNDSSLHDASKINYTALVKIVSDGVIHRLIKKDEEYTFGIDALRNFGGFVYANSAWGGAFGASTQAIQLNKIELISITVDTSLPNNNMKTFLNGIAYGTYDKSGSIIETSNSVNIGFEGTFPLDGILYYTSLVSNGISKHTELFNTLARLPLYSHNFTQYPNSDTSLTSIFPYISGIIISGLFNKTDGLKCTSAGTIIFSNNFEFDGSEYLTLTIDGVEYSGTTTVTQGTITATIAQGSNDITIEMGTNDVLEDIQIQFRSEV